MIRQIPLKDTIQPFIFAAENLFIKLLFIS